ncbi:hypothetical protein [Bradyrhizobium sp. BWA-3-5]|uniref:hypothetical protein n=1 Tax=Bradyrhizobium sp. BWA-3-5 TaxID=3080013 RepID=UPI00293F7062|nr:hypothetical protein [Bradyrhizobium sp. BWA-3-5]WOH70078.1 hypothetical protein RX331_23420 [Bradyrhizobium sp. BWA-3-5]
MTRPHAVKTALPGGAIEHAAQPPRLRKVVGRAGPIQLRQKPQPLLRKRQCQRAFASNLSYQRSFLAATPVYLLGEDNKLAQAFYIQLFQARPNDICHF